MDELLKLTIDNNMSIYKTAFEEGKKFGYAEGGRDAWQEANKQIDKLLEATKQIMKGD